MLCWAGVGGLAICTAWWNSSNRLSRAQERASSAFQVISRRREFCHSAAPPSHFSRRFNRDDGGVPAE